MIIFTIELFDDWIMWWYNNSSWWAAIMLLDTATMYLCTFSLLKFRSQQIVAISSDGNCSFPPSFWNRRLRCLLLWCLGAGYKYNEVTHNFVLVIKILFVTCKSAKKVLLHTRINNVICVKRHYFGTTIGIVIDSKASKLPLLMNLTGKWIWMLNITTSKIKNWSFLDRLLVIFMYSFDLIL